MLNPEYGCEPCVELARAGLRWGLLPLVGFMRGCWLTTLEAAARARPEVIRQPRQCMLACVRGVRQAQLEIRGQNWQMQCLQKHKTLAVAYDLDTTLNEVFAIKCEDVCKRSIMIGIL